MTGKTQSYARQLNNQLIMRELRAGCCSATMLSHKLHLSNAAMTQIIAKLQENGYIKQVETDNRQCIGRRPIYYTVNENFGYIVVISLANHYANVVVSDMKMNIVERVETRVEKYDLAMLYQLMLIVKNILGTPQCRDIPLYGIDLSIPGRVNTLTGELQLSPQFDNDIFHEKNTIVELFHKQFNVPVVMTNDINLAGLGEMYKGSMQGVDNGMLVHVDEGIGGALILNGKLFTGSQGFSGEVGLMHTVFHGKTDCLDEFVSLRAIKNVMSERFGKKLHTADIAELFQTDAFVHDYVCETAVCLGKVLKDVVELLNISKIVLSGRIKLFGEQYIELVKNEVSQSIDCCEVEFSTLDSDAAIIGAIFKAVEALTDDIFV